MKSLSILKENIIELCNKNAGLEIPFSELPNRKWLGSISGVKCYSPIFSLESKDVTLRDGTLQSIPIKCTLLYGISKDDLDVLFEDDEKALNDLYTFITNKTSFKAKLKQWLSQNWMSLIAIIISIIAIFV